jgi:hypothetical protein
MDLYRKSLHYFRQRGRRRNWTESVAAIGSIFIRFISVILFCTSGSLIVARKRSGLRFVLRDLDRGCQ